MSRAHDRLACAVLALLGVAMVSGCESTGAIAPSYPGTLLLVAEDEYSTLAEIEPNGGNVRYRYPVAGPVEHIAVSRNGQYAATIDARGEITVCDLFRQGIDARFTVAHGSGAVGLAFADRRSSLAVAFAGSGDVRVIDRDSGALERTSPTGSSAVRALRAGRRGEVVAACDGPARLARIDVDSGTVLESVDLPAPPVAVACPEEFARTVVALESADGARLWCADRPDLGLVDGMVSLGISADGATIYAGESSRGSVVRIVGAAAATRVRIGEPDPGTTWSTVLDPHARNVFVALPRENRVVVVDVESGMVRGTYAELGRPGVVAWVFQRVPPEVGFGVGRR